MKHLDLFSGIGGFALSARWAEIETIQFVEKDLFCQKVLGKNFPGVPIHDDIKTFKFNKKVDLITGGFPCQPFSQAGSKKGKADERYLWPEFYRIIRESNPHWIIAENVGGAVGMVLDDIIIDLEAEKYTTETFVLPACAAHAPHRRDRLWIVAHLNSQHEHLLFQNKERNNMEKNIKWNLEKVKSKWYEFFPRSWKINSANDWFRDNARNGRNIDGIPDWVDRIKSLGNAVVPQIPYVFFEMIKEIESLLNPPS